MRYSDGQLAEIGDRVALDGREGVVVCSIDDCAYTESYTAPDWSYLQSGFLIDFVDFGLVHYKEGEPGLSLMSRNKPEPNRS